MSEFTYHVTGIGNAIVDILAHAPDEFLLQHQMIKGSMALIDEAAAEHLYATMPPATEISGGSAANTIAGICSLGGKTAYIGKVRNDQLGAIFSHDIRSQGVTFNSAPATEGESTARCFVIITPDAQRTMSTYLGAAGGITVADIDEQVIASSKVTYLEGYLWDRPAAKEAIRKAITIAKKHGRKIALTLSDSFCVERHREEFLQLITHHVDILFANEDEIIALFQCQDFEEAVQHVWEKCSIAALTRGGKGSVIVAQHESHHVVCQPCTLVDTTGAGDLYAGGFLYGYTQGLPLMECGRLGSIAAAEVISHIGARPAVALRDLI
jgi:sugar/nucleoside kinase (ribokinase family)